jgi:hypothetical protein
MAGGIGQGGACRNAGGTQGVNQPHTEEEKDARAMSKAQMPPVPPENRAPQGGSNNAGQGELNPKDAQANEENRKINTGSQGQPGNIAQNTRNQGYQQDR